MGLVTQTGVMHELESAPMKSMSGIIATATLLFAPTPAEARRQARAARRRLNMSWTFIARMASYGQKRGIR